MPQLNNAVLKDGATTPANHTFTPDNISGGVATLIESTGVPIGDKRLTVSLVQTSAGRRKVTMKLTIPVVQDATVNGVTRPTVVRTAYADLTFSYDGSSSLQERKDTRAYIVSALADTMFFR
uniref:Coat protein n=1 Tax=Leviviridae sp. TaxID=2027243 RepID=A0A514D4Z7_9VIRU|nr:MAG: hypothetical protein H1Bulk304066_000002 [Leviviridae sp.]